MCHDKFTPEAGVILFQFERCSTCFKGEKHIWCYFTLFDDCRHQASDLRRFWWMKTTEKLAIWLPGFWSSYMVLLLLLLLKVSPVNFELIGNNNHTIIESAIHIYPQRTKKFLDFVYSLSLYCLSTEPLCDVIEA